MAHQFYFGTGNLFITPNSANPTPINVAAIQNVSVDFDGDLKQLFGQLSFPLDTARGKTKVTGKFEVGQINAGLWNAVFFGLSGAGAQGVTTGQTLYAYNEGPTAIPTTPFQITVANAAHFSQDLGCYNSATGIPFQRVASGPTAGQYSVNTSTGVYTFSSADNVSAISVVFNYEYTASATGQNLPVVNTLMGNIPVFRLDLTNQTKGKNSVLQLYACTSSKLQFPFKQDDYGMQTFDFSVQDDGTGRILNWATTEG